MKKIVLFLLIFALAMPAIEARTFALLTAVSNYNGEENNLYSTDGAKKFRDILKKQTKDIVFLTSKYANRENILAKARQISAAAVPGDRIIFFYDGHGYPGGLACYDSAIPYEELVAVFDDSKASEVFFFIEACHSGSAATEALDNTGSYGSLRAKQGRIYLLSSRADEYSILNTWINKSYFTQALIAGYRGACDKNGDKAITVEELFVYMHQDIVRRSGDQQHPVLIAPKSMYNTVLIRYK